MKFTRKQIIDYIYNSDAVMSFYQSAMVVGFWPDYSDHQIEQLAWDLEHADIDDITIIDSLLNEYGGILRKYIAHIYAGRTRIWRVTPEFLCTLVLIVKFPELFAENYLAEKGWDKDIANIVCLSAGAFNLNTP